MSAYNKFESWVEYKNEGANCATDQFTALLTNTAPVATNTLAADIVEISYTNLSSRDFTTASSGQTAGTYRLILDPLQLDATGTIPDFQYVVIADTTLAGSPLVCWTDVGAVVSLTNGQSYTITPDQVDGLFLEE